MADGSTMTNFDQETPAIWRPEPMEAVYRIKMTATGCDLVERTAAFCGLDTVTFTDGKALPLSLCFLLTDAGKAAGEALRDRSAVHQESFKWPVTNWPKQESDS